MDISSGNEHFSILIKLSIKSTHESFSIKLRIPITVVNTITVSPVRWIHHLMECIFPQSQKGGSLWDVTNDRSYLDLDSPLQLTGTTRLEYRIDYNVPAIIADPELFMWESEDKGCPSSTFDEVMERDSLNVDTPRETEGVQVPCCTILNFRRGDISEETAHHSANSCHAIYLIPRAKQSPYMQVVSDEEISSIDDPRNCLFIDESLQILFGLKCGSEPNTFPICSFLRIPNNFMKREHSCVHPTDESQNSHLLEQDTRVHFHAFDKKYLDSVSISAMLEVGALYDNKLVRLPPQDTPNAVPSFLWDMHYGCTALACWAEHTEEFSAFGAMVKEYYKSACEAYLDEDDENEDDGHDDDHMDIKGKRRAIDPEDDEEAENSPRKRTRTEPARELDAFDIVGALWMMSAAVKQKRENDDRVSSWRKEVP